MALKTRKADAAAALDLILNNICNGAAGWIDIRSGAAPANIAAAATGVLLATCDLLDLADAYGNTDLVTLIATGNEVGGIFAEEDAIIATGVAGYFRMFDATGVARLQGSITVIGGGGDLELSDINLIATGTITINGSTIEITGIT